jgi:glycosyltransferase involved in cell wall biosynthesis
LEVGTGQAPRRPLHQGKLFMQSTPSDRLDVLLMLGTYQLRGSYARALSLMQYLPNPPVRLRVVSTDVIPGNPEFLSRLEVRISRNLGWKLLGLPARRFLAADFRRRAPGLIDIQQRSLHSAGSWLARRLQRPYIVTVHDYLRDRERFIIDPDWCRQVVAVSESVRSELLDRTQLPESLVSVIPSGVRPVEEKELTNVLREGHAPIIGTVGPLEAGKGLQHFLRAAVAVLERHPRAMFVIAGSGPEERSLRRLANDLKVSHAVTILPNLPDFATALQALDIFVLPAIKQGLASTMLDAMSRRLPVIATESGGVYSVVLDGETGLMIPPSDPAAMAEKICYLIENPLLAQQLGVAARQRVLEHFRVEQMVSSTLHLYRKFAIPSSTKK